MVLEPLPLNINTCHIYVGFYNDDIQQESIGIHTCDVDMVSALPTDRKEILLIAHNSDDDCRFILEYLQNVEPIAKKVIDLHRSKQDIITLNLKRRLILQLQVLIS